MNIAVDIGNTNTKCGIFASSANGDELVGFWRLPSTNTRCWINERFLQNMTRLGVLTNQISPPVKRTTKEEMTESYPKPLTWNVAQTGSGFPLNKFKTAILTLRPKDKFKVITRKQISLKLDVDVPAKAGIDRLLAAFAAVKKYGDVPMLIVDAGTAMTIDVVQDQTFCGGAILPGAAFLTAMYPHISSKLPKVRSPERMILEARQNYPGKNTKDAICNGIYWGAIGAIRQFYEMAFSERRLVTSAKVILTGGDAEYLLPGLSGVIASRQIEHRNALVLEGINWCTK
jgi:pantothenate kinase type III